MKSDPWQEAHDQLEKDLEEVGAGPNYWEEIIPAINSFVNRIEELLGNYKPFSVGVKSPPQTLGFYAGSLEKAADRFSLQKKHCAGCNSIEKIKMKKNPKTGGTTIVCEECWRKMK